jgi:hypothetical protein
MGFSFVVVVISNVDVVVDAIAVTVVVVVDGVVVVVVKSGGHCWISLFTAMNSI